jgi:hypothetical protein
MVITVSTSTVDATYMNHEYKVQPLNGLKIAINGTGISKHSKKILLQDCKMQLRSIKKNNSNNKNLK